MGRRYLDRSEAEAALGRGKTVECFIGPCHGHGKVGIRWLSIRLLPGAGGFEASRFDTADYGSEAFTDLYEFGPLDDALELEEADERMRSDSLAELLTILESRYPGCVDRLVNEGVIQDEYADFVAKRSAA